MTKSRHKDTVPGADAGTGTGAATATATGAATATDAANAPLVLRCHAES